MTDDCRLVVPVEGDRLIPESLTYELVSISQVRVSGTRYWPPLRNYAHSLCDWEIVNRKLHCFFSEKITYNRNPYFPILQSKNPINPVNQETLLGILLVASAPDLNVEIHIPRKGA